jgi:hypothetical protein
MNMKKVILIGVAVVFAVVALGVAGVVYAYAQTPTPPFTPGSQFGGMMRGRGGMGGMRGGMMGGQGGQYAGSMHTYMVEAVAKALDISVDDLNAELTAGKTMWQVAEDKGLTQEQFTTVMQDARKVALAKMVEDGVITQEQADWMLSRMAGQNVTGQDGPNGCPGMGGQGGFGGGRMGPGGGGRWNNQPAPAPTTNG